MRPASIGKPAGTDENAWKAWVTQSLTQLGDYSQQVFISLVGDVTSLAGGSQITTTLASKLNSITASGTPANLTDTTSFSSTFTNYEIIIDNLVPANNAVKLQLLLRNAGVFQTANYLNSAGGVTTYIDVTQGNIGNNAGLGVNGRITLFNPSATNTNKFVTGSVAYYTGAAVVGAQTAGTWIGAPTQTAIDGIRFAFTAGNILSGSIAIRGLP